MPVWKWFNLIASGVICAAGLVTLFFLLRVLCKAQTAENKAKFRKLMTLFCVLAVLALVLNVVSWALRYAFCTGSFSGL